MEFLFLNESSNNIAFQETSYEDLNSIILEAIEELNNCELDCIQEEFKYYLESENNRPIMGQKENEEYSNKVGLIKKFFISLKDFLRKAWTAILNAISTIIAKVTNFMKRYMHFTQKKISSGKVCVSKNVYDLWKDKSTKYSSFKNDDKTINEIKEEIEEISKVEGTTFLLGVREKDDYDSLKKGHFNPTSWVRMTLDDYEALVKKALNELKDMRKHLAIAKNNSDKEVALAESKKENLEKVKESAKKVIENAKLVLKLFNVGFKKLLFTSQLTEKKSGDE